MKIRDIDLAVDLPWFLDMMESDEELDFDDVMRVFDYFGVDVVAVPRGSSRLDKWYCLTEIPFDDGGKNREKTALERVRSSRKRKK